MRIVHWVNAVRCYRGQRRGWGGLCGPQGHPGGLAAGHRFHAHGPPLRAAGGSTVLVGLYLSAMAVLALIAPATMKETRGLEHVSNVSWARIQL